MYSLQQRIQTPQSAALICARWFNSQSIACGSLDGEIIFLENTSSTTSSTSTNQFIHSQTVQVTQKKASLISLHSFGLSSLLSTSFDGAVCIWQKGKESSTWEQCCCNDEFLPTDLMTTAASDSGVFVNSRADGAVGIYSQEHHQLQQQTGTFFNSATTGKHFPITALSLPNKNAASIVGSGGAGSGKHQQLALGNSNGIVLLADLTSQRTFQTLSGHSNQPIQTLDTNPHNASLVLSGGKDGLVCLWDGRAGCLAASFAFSSQAEWISKVQFSPTAPDAFFLAASAAAGAVKWVDLRAGASAAHCWSDVGTGALAECSPEGDRVAVLGQREVSLYRVPN
jgi:WD40 repeat protein